MSLGSGIRRKPIPDPGSGSATLVFKKWFWCQNVCNYKPVWCKISNILKQCHLCSVKEGNKVWALISTSTVSKNCVPIMNINVKTRTSFIDNYNSIDFKSFSEPTVCGPCFIKKQTTGNVKSIKIRAICTFCIIKSGRECARTALSAGCGFSPEKRWRRRGLRSPPRSGKA